LLADAKRFAALGVLAAWFGRHAAEGLSVRMRRRTSVQRKNLKFIESG
jgi:hypothetical protein